jgi:hypothetical protein
VRPDDQPGRRSQIGGGLAVFIGMVWLVAVPSGPPGAQVDIHKAGWIFLMVGIFGLAVGTLGRWLYLK